MRMLVLFVAASVLISMIVEKKKWRVATVAQSVVFIVLLWMLIVTSDVPVIEYFAYKVFGENVVIGTKEIVNAEVEGMGVMPIVTIELAVFLNLILLVCMVTVDAVMILTKQPKPNEIYFGTVPEPEYKLPPVKNNEHQGVEARYMFCVMLC